MEIALAKCGQAGQGDPGLFSGQPQADECVHYTCHRWRRRSATTIIMVAHTVNADGIVTRRFS
jgi:hypothetical protein